MKERIVKIIAGLILVMEILLIATVDVGFIGISIMCIIGLFCLIIVGSEFTITKEESRN